MAGAGTRAADSANYRGVFDGGLGFGRRSAVVVVDFLKAYTAPGSALHCPGRGSGAADAAAAAVPLLALARSRGVPVLYAATRYDHPADGGLLAQKVPLLRSLTRGSALAEIDEAVAPQAGDRVLGKHYLSAFFGTSLASDLQALGVDTCIVVGCSTSGGVRATVLEGMQLGFRCVVPRECVGDREEAVHEANLFDINAKNGDVMPTAAVMDHLTGLPTPDAAAGQPGLPAKRARVGEAAAPPAAGAPAPGPKDGISADANASAQNNRARFLPQLRPG
ncbi:unnamed protein product, partial [Prorocentrum cordatum]